MKIENSNVVIGNNNNIQAVEIQVLMHKLEIKQLEIEKYKEKISLLEDWVFYLRKDLKSARNFIYHIVSNGKNSFSRKQIGKV